METYEFLICRIDIDKQSMVEDILFPFFLLRTFFYINHVLFTD